MNYANDKLTETSSSRRTLFQTLMAHGLKKRRSPKFAIAIGNGGADRLGAPIRPTLATTGLRAMVFFSPWIDAVDLSSPPRIIFTHSFFAGLVPVGGRRTRYVNEVAVYAKPYRGRFWVPVSVRTFPKRKFRPQTRIGRMDTITVALHLSML
jgi:hypothetical protein